MTVAVSRAYPTYSGMRLSRGGPSLPLSAHLPLVNRSQITLRNESARLALIGRVVRQLASRQADAPMERDALSELSREQLIELVLGLAAEVAELKAQIGRPPKTPGNSSAPPDHL
jgi:hypothetical protein